MNAPRQPSQQIVAAVQVQQVRLVEGRCRTTVRAPEPGMVINYPVRARLKEHRPDGTFCVEASVEARVTKKKSQRPRILVEATFELTYKLPRTMSVSTSELEVFANTNAIFNVWPYFREFIQSMFERMALPAPILPLYKGSLESRDKTRDKQ